MPVFSRPKHGYPLLPAAFFLAFCLPAIAFALNPSEVLVIVNATVPEGIELSSYYMKKRGIPAENLVRVTVKDQETVSRVDYDKKIAAPVSQALKQRPAVRCLLLMYGVPLRVAAPEIGPKERRLIVGLRQKQDEIQRRIEGLPSAAAEGKKGLTQELAAIDADIARARKYDQSASVDSEIALVRAGSHSLSGPLPSPLFLGNRNRELAVGRDKALMVSRLDGPTGATVRRVIDDSLEAERQGLSGFAYFDARWPEPAEMPKDGYGFYDASIHRAARVVSRSNRMPAKLDAQEALFQPGDCPEAALYCGWYSLGTYIDAFAWKKGAVGYHIASSECVTLKKKGSRVWCKRMLEEGAAAVVGPVEEPYIQAFPVPEIFFRLLVEGDLSLAECYALATPWVSWRMVLIGDPLYRPFAALRGKQP
jgi:uncharacterized protein (TIGR03790 family)